MSYREAMEAAGAVVHACKHFGTYQGDGWALVTFGGVTGWVSFGFGSCSTCDPFERAFCDGEPSREELARFGRDYLDEVLTPGDAIGRASKHIEWDTEAEDVVAFIRCESVTHGLLPESTP